MSPRRWVGEQRCSFCERSQDQVERLIAGPHGVFICDECVALCQQVLDADRAKAAVAALAQRQIPSPREIVAQLDEYVVGQDRAKKVLSVAVYNHYKRIVSGAHPADVELQKSNILLIGPTGCGKTLLARTLARILEVPFALAEATGLTEAGYVGEDVETILARLLQAADYDTRRAEMGIVYIDEIDKIARKSGASPTTTRDVSGEGVQQALLRIIEGTVANVPPWGSLKHPQREYVQLDTTNILFICGGAFEGLAEIVAERLGQRGRIGFVHEAEPRERQEESTTALLRQVVPDDLLRYGMLPEFVGRLPVTVSVEPLDQAALVAILTQPKNALVKQFQRLFALDGVDLVFTPDALQAVAAAAMKQGTGARGLRTVIEETLLDVMYEIPSRPDVVRCVVTAEAIRGEKPPLLLTSTSERAAVVEHTG